MEEKDSSGGYGRARYQQLWGNTAQFFCDKLTDQLHFRL